MLCLSFKYITEIISLNTYKGKFYGIKFLHHEILSLNMLLFVLYKTLSYQRLNATFKLQLLQPFRQFEENTEIRMYNIEIYDITLLYIKLDH